MSDVFQFLEIQRTDRDKKSIFLRVNEFVEIYGEYRQQAAGATLDYLEV